MYLNYLCQVLQEIIIITVLDKATSVMLFSYTYVLCFAG